MKAAIFALLITGGFFSLNVNAETATTIGETEVREAPWTESASITILPAQSRVEVVKRNQGWVQIKLKSASKPHGWVKVLKLKWSDESTKPRHRPDFGYPATCSKQSAPRRMFVAYCDESGTFIQSQLNFAELKRMYTFDSSADKALQFANSGNLRKRPIEYVQSKLSPAKTSHEISELQEIALGEGMASILLGEAPLLKNGLMQRYVNKVGRYLAMQTERPDLPWHFGVMDSASINSFATPGGHVFVTKGMMEILNSEAELAGVLSHEIAHVLSKHHLNAMEKTRGAGILTDLSSVVAVEKSASNDPENILGKNLIGSMKEVLLRGLDQSAEHEADRMSVVIAARAGYDSIGLVAVLQRLDGLTASSKTELMFSTMPSPRSRLDVLPESMQNDTSLHRGQLLASRYRRHLP